MPEDVIAEMTANVWKVLVRQGDPVKNGEEIAILESMKMEIPVVSGSDGTVAEVRVAENNVVNEGDVIVTISPD